MRRIGSLNDWTRFLDAHGDDEATAALTGHIRYLDRVYDDLNSLMRQLWDSPGTEVGDTLQIARMAIAETAGMLESVRDRYDAGERESA